MKQPSLKYLNKDRAILLRGYSFTLVINNKRHKFIIPKGWSQYNGFSNPRLFWTLLGISKWGYQNPASLIHDYIYRLEGKLYDVEGNEVIVSRKFTDNKLKEDLIKLKYTKYQSNLSYIGARIGGYYFWREL